jgi:hypothetical protein
MSNGERSERMKLSMFFFTLSMASRVPYSYKYHSYLPSEWEVLWAKNIAGGLWRNGECEQMAVSHNLDRALFSVWKAQIWANQSIVNDRPANSFELNTIFSRLRYIDSFNHTVDRYIEPLVGILRDPLTMCDNLINYSGRFESTESWVQAKRFLVHDFETINSLPFDSKLILMDLGASTYNGWGDDEAAVGAKWFVERFKSNTQVPFDRIFSFEFVKHSPEEIFRDLPKYLWSRYMYFNVAVSADPTQASHSWNILLSIAKPSDYVIVKLDIDARDIERALVQQLLDNNSYSSIVDEFFFEHHVNAVAMHRYWGLQHDETTMRHSYKLFHELRERGIRAHCWP